MDRVTRPLIRPAPPATFSRRGRRGARIKCAFARGLRRTQTRAEALLWQALRNGGLDGLKFRRQVPIGRFIADFLCVEHRLIVELDGPPHDTPDAQAHDAARDTWLRQQGTTVLRLPDDLVIGGANLPLDRIRTTLRPHLAALPSPATREKVAREA